MVRNMRIFEVIEQSSNLAVPTNRTWLRNLYEPLVDMGHEVVLFPAEEGRAAMLAHDSKARERFSERMVEAFKEEHTRKPFQLAFFYLMDGMFDTWAIDEIRNVDVPTCNFSCNNIHQFDLVEKISAHFDWNLYAEKDAGNKFRSIGVRASWWPMASNPKYFRPVTAQRDIEVSFSGANYGKRLEAIYQLLLNGIGVHVYGPGWTQNGKRCTRFWALARSMTRALKAVMGSSEDRARYAAQQSWLSLQCYALQRYAENFHEPLTDEDLIALYSRSTVSLGFLDVLENHDPIGRRLRHMHLRDFEAPLCGALYCTDYSDELAEMFEPDKEVIVCHDDIERVDKIRHFLNHPEQGEKIRQAGRKRALACHTYHRRFETLFALIGLAGR